VSKFPFYIQQAVDLDLLQTEDDKIVSCREDAVKTVMGTARLIEKIQPTTAAKTENTTDQEAIVLCRVLSSPSGKARELWAQLRTGFGVGHGQPIPQNLWSTPVFKAIGGEIDRTFMGERNSAVISRESLITQFADLNEANRLCGMAEFNKTISDLAQPETMESYGDGKSEWDTALDLLRQFRVRALYRETLHDASQVGRSDSKLEKSIEFLQQRSMECLGLLRGSIGQQNNFVSLVEDLIGDESREGYLDKIMNKRAGIRPISTGCKAFDIDMEGGIMPPNGLTHGGRMFTIAGRTGEGKCFKVNTPVIMADGSVRPVQDVREGDRVLGPDGTPRLVYGLSRGSAPMYKITPVKGDSYTVNDEHILSLRVTGGQKNTLEVSGVRYRGGDIVNIEVRDYLKLSAKKKHLLKGWRSGVVEFHGAPAYSGPLTPYLVGAYLGDGYRHGPKLTLSDSEIIEELRAFCAANDYKLYETDEPGCTGCAISTGRGAGGNPVLNWIRDYDFVGRGKYIPDSLKRGSVQQRLELLAGLIDTDGHLEQNCYDLVFKEQELADGVAFVARSLGLAAYVSECVKKIKSLDFSGTYYRICISGDLSMIPCRVKHKQAKERSQIKNVLNTGIKVESVGVDDYYGFALIGPDRLFLLGDFTVTHNTQLGVSIAANAVAGGLTVGFISAELDEDSIKARVWSSLTHVFKGRSGAIFSGKLQAPDEARKEQTCQTLMEVGQQVQTRGGNLLAEAPWGANADTVVATLRSMKARNPELRLAVLDHFHALAKHKGAPSNEATAQEERAYKLMTAAKELDIDLIVLAQMNRVGMDSIGKTQPPTLDQIRGTDALAHVSHAVWILRKQVEVDDMGDKPIQRTTGKLELWHAKVRGRQAVWKESTKTIEGIGNFIDKSILQIHHPTSTVEWDDTNA